MKFHWAAIKESQPQKKLGKILRPVSLLVVVVLTLSLASSALAEEISGTTILISKAIINPPWLYLNSPEASNFKSDFPSISGITGTLPNGLAEDGRFVVFSSQAVNLDLTDIEPCTADHTYYLDNAEEGVRPTDCIPQTSKQKYDVFLEDRDADEDGTYDGETTYDQRGLFLLSPESNPENDPTKEFKRESVFGVISRDGRYIVFQSAFDLLIGDTNGVSDIYLFDRVKFYNNGHIRGTEANYLTLISDPVSPLDGDLNPIPNNDHSGNTLSRGKLTSAGTLPAAISLEEQNNHSGAGADHQGHYQLYGQGSGSQSCAEHFGNAYPGGLIADESPDGAQCRATLKMNGGYDHPSAAVFSYPGPGTGGFAPTVIFESRATNIVPDLPLSANRKNLYRSRFKSAASITVNDVLTHAWNSTSDNFTEANGDSEHPVVSPDGCGLAFVSKATNLIEGVTPAPNLFNVYLMLFNRKPGFDYCEGDESIQSIRLISRPDGTVGDNEAIYPAITREFDKNFGEYVGPYYVAFETRNSLLPAVDTNNTSDIYLYSFNPENSNQEWKLVSTDSTGAISNQSAYNPSLSADGRLVAFYSYADNLVSNDLNICSPTDPASCPDVFIHDWTTNLTWRVSLTQAGEEMKAGSFRSALSDNGRYIAYTSGGRPDSGQYDGQWRIFVRDQGRVPGNPEVNPSSWRFGRQSTGNETKIFRLQALADVQIGSFALVLKPQDASIIPPIYVISNNTCANTTLLKGNTCQFEVSFNSEDGRAHSAILEIRNVKETDPNLTYLSYRTIQIALSGQGKSPLYFPFLWGKP